jgi:serine/threonine protein kinase
MDKYKATQLEKELKDKDFKEYKILELINNGKSAAVFKASKGDELYALKIFDNDLIERFGHEIQTKRIEQEISLKNHTINNLVKIYDGGKESILDQDYYFIVMELISGKNLKDYIVSENYQVDFVYEVLNKLYQTTEELLIQKNIVHRDIKPENIMVNDSNEIILMDLGVLKLVGAKSFSDEEEKSFVGTLRYAAPEFLLRKEEDSINGWRALNFYQIGATLHDLINKKELFIEKVPYSNLVIAIKDDNVVLSNDNFSFEFLQLVRDMLAKDWKKRLSLISSQRLNKISIDQSNLLDTSIDKLLKKRVKYQATFDEIDNLRRSNEEKAKKKRDIAISIRDYIDNSFDILQEKGIFNKQSRSENFKFYNDLNTSKGNVIQNYLYELKGDLQAGFLRDLYLLIRVSNDEEGAAKISCLGVFPSISNQFQLKNPLQLFENLYKENNRSQQSYNRGMYSLRAKPQISIDFKVIDIFEGIINFDESLKTHLITSIIQVITKALDLVEKDVELKLEEFKKMQNSTESFRFTVSTSRDMKNIIIDKL